MAGAVVVVWLLAILWSVPGALAGSAQDEVYVEQRATTQQTGDTWQPDSETWLADAPIETSLALLLGWIPGAVYAGLLLLVRKAVEEPVDRLGGVEEARKHEGK